MQQMQMMAAPQQQATMQPSDIAKLFNSECEFLSIQSHEWSLADAEARLLAKFGSKKGPAEKKKD